jgi:hypothetical protein
MTGSHHRPQTSGLFSTGCALATLLMAVCARADDAPYMCTVGQTSKTIRLSAVEEDGGCAGFEVRETSGKLIQSYRGWLGSGSLVASGDGSRVVFVQMAPLASIGKDGQIKLVGAKESASPGVEIFGGGKRLGSFDINQLVARPRMVTESISHILWVRNARLVTGPRVSRKVPEILALQSSMIWTGAMNRATSLFLRKS